MPDRSTFEFRFAEDDKDNEEIRNLKAGVWLSVTATPVSAEGSFFFEIKHWKISSGGGLQELKTCSSLVGNLVCFILFG